MAYNDKAEAIKDFKKGDFVKLSGQEKKSKGKDGKEYIILKVNEVKLLKAKQQVKDTSKVMDTTELKDKIQKLKIDIEEREKDHYYADSWDQAGQIRNDIEKMKKELQNLENNLGKATKQINQKMNDKDNKDKTSVTHKLNQYKEKVKEQSSENIKKSKNVER